HDWPFYFEMFPPVAHPNSSPGHPQRRRRPHLALGERCGSTPTCHIKAMRESFPRRRLSLLGFLPPAFGLPGGGLGDIPRKWRLPVLIGQKEATMWRSFRNLFHRAPTQHLLAVWFTIHAGAALAAFYVLWGMFQCAWALLIGKTPHSGCSPTQLLAESYCLTL